MQIKAAAANVSLNSVVDLFHGDDDAFSFNFTSDCVPSAGTTADMQSMSGPQDSFFTIQEFGLSLSDNIATASDSHDFPPPGQVHSFLAPETVSFLSTSQASLSAEASDSSITIPSGSESEIAFVSGITSSATVAGTSYWTWTGGNPAAYSSYSGVGKWGGTTLSTSGTAGGNVTYWFDTSSNWTAAEKSAWVSSFGLWSAVGNISFSQAANASSANIQLRRGSDGGAYSHSSSSGASVGSGTDGSFQSTGDYISIDTSVGGFGPIGGSFSLYGGYPYQTMVHEIGHAIGLGHGGPYNGNVTSSTQQFSAYDTRLWTIMSYIDPWDTSAKYYGSYPVTGTNWGISPDYYYYEPLTPMVLDDLAIQRIYGVATSGPLASGGQTFGFNCNVGGTIDQYFNFTINTHPVITIWDGGFNNTLDLSGFSSTSTVNLNAGTYSSCNGETNNLGIAEGTVIETLVCGSGNDTLTGSSYNNVLTGGSGNDTVDGGGGNDVLFGNSGTNNLIGGSGFDEAVFDGTRSSYTITSTSVSKSGDVNSLSGIEAQSFIEVRHGGPNYIGGAQYADLNGDGKADLIYHAPDNSFWVSLSTGTDLTTPTKWLQHGGSFMAGESQYADVNGDGNADLIFQGTANKFWVSLSTGSGFATPAAWMQHGGSFIAGHAQYADLNADGKADLIFQGNDNRFWVSVSTGSGFSAPTQWLQHGGSFIAGEAQYADLNADGRADMIYQGTDNRFWASLSTGSGFTGPALWVQHGGPFIAGEAQYADVSGDGKADLIYQATDNSFWVSLSTGSAFTTPTKWVQHGGSFANGAVHYADLNGDGKADLILQGNDNQIWANLSTGSGFSAAQEIAHFNGSQPSSQLQVVDVSGDHHADLVMQNVTNQFLLSLNGPDFHLV